MDEEKTMPLPEQKNSVVEKLEKCYGTKEVADFLGCSIPTAREIMNQKDFPLLRAGKNLRVYPGALKQWAMSRHT